MRLSEFAKALSIVVMRSLARPANDRDSCLGVGAGGCPHPEAETAEIKWIYLTESIIENESLGYKARATSWFPRSGRVVA